MPRKNGTMETYFIDHDYTSSCEVRIDGVDIAVSYIENGVPKVYRGNEIAPGHFELRSAQGEATLHLSPGGDRLEGHWKEAGNTGMWLIEIDEE